MFGKHIEITEGEHQGKRGKVLGSVGGVHTPLRWTIILDGQKPAASIDNIIYGINLSGQYGVIDICTLSESQFKVIPSK